MEEIKVLSQHELPQNIYYLGKRRIIRYGLQTIHHIYNNYSIVYYRYKTSALTRKSYLFFDIDGIETIKNGENLHMFLSVEKARKAYRERLSKRKQRILASKEKRRYENAKKYVEYYEKKE